MQDGVEEALGDVPTTFACLMIQTTINTQLESALCMEFSHVEKENFKLFTTTISPVLCAAYASMRVTMSHSDDVSSLESILTNTSKAAAILLWKQVCAHPIAKCLFCMTIHLKGELKMIFNFRYRAAK